MSNILTFQDIFRSFCGNPETFPPESRVISAAMFFTPFKTADFTKMCVSKIPRFRAYRQYNTRFDNKPRLLPHAEVASKSFQNIGCLLIYFSIICFIQFFRISSILVCSTSIPIIIYFWRKLCRFNYY